MVAGRMHSALHTLCRFDKAYCVRCYSLFSAAEAETFLGRRLYIDCIKLTMKGCGDVLPHLKNIWRKLWSLRYDSAIDIHYAKALFLHKLMHI